MKAAQNVSFEVPAGKLFTLLGPSGCGKTTTLRSIAGLERPTSGEICVDGTPVYSSTRNVFIAPNHRNFGMVFQSYAIWPHMNVFENAAFPLRVKKDAEPAAVIKAKVERVLAAVQLEHLAGREATRLSGGQQQRLALARALVMEPPLLLLDEPLSNLDAKLRERMRFELKRIQRELNLTTVYVTHDQSEALALSHEIAVMNEGRIVQTGTPREIYQAPQTRFVADFIGTTNLLEGRIVSAQSGGQTIADTPVGRLVVGTSKPLVPGDTVSVSIRPEDILIATTELTGAVHNQNRLSGNIDALVFLGDLFEVKIRCGGEEILARAHPSFAGGEGDPVYLTIDADKCVAIAGKPNEAPPVKQIA